MRGIKRACAAGAFSALALAACQDTSSPPVQWSHLSPAGQTLAFEGIEGPPPAIRSELLAELASAASSRSVDVTGSALAARYRVKGYLKTETTEDGGTALAFVWDVFDASKRRAKRVAGLSPIRASGAEAWQDLNREALRRLAGRSMDEIAAFLASRNDPEAPG